VIDTDFAMLDHLARQLQPVAPGRAAGVAEAPLQSAPPPGLCSAPDAAAVAGQNVWLVHAWDLADAPPGLLRVAVLDSDFHAHWPWSAARWRFVGTRMQAACDLLWWGTSAQLTGALRSAASVQGHHDPHLGAGWQALALTAPARLFCTPTRACASFSQFWTCVTRGLNQAAELG
jgi:deoxyribodipyrimidine photo-lyase